MLKPRAPDEGVCVDTIEWQDFPQALHTGGLRYKLLHVGPEIASWTVLFEATQDLQLAAHVHHGPALGWIFSGEAIVRGGFENGGFVSGPNTFGYEAAGARHDVTLFRAGTRFLIHMVGPIQWILDDGKVVMQSWDDAQALWEEQNRKSAAA